MKHWPHAPSHVVTHPGAYIVTAGNYQKEHHFRGDDRLDFLEETILATFEEFGWSIQQWAVFTNHYHVIAHSPVTGSNLRKVTNKIHSVTASQANRCDGTPGRKVWFQYWETRLTFEKSYLARLNYVRTNAVRHGLVLRPEDYRWCGANWFLINSEKPFYDTVTGFQSDY